MMRAHPTEQTDSASVSMVQVQFADIGWGPVENKSHDLGTDLLVQARDDRRFERGLVVGAQVKGGPSYFTSEKRAKDGALQGWWYAESDVEHFDDWVQHGLPHLLILHNKGTKVSYWVHVTAEAIE